MTPLSVVCWRWTPPRGYRSSYDPDTVRVLRNMVARHYPHPHRFLCVTDTPQDLPDVECVPIWDEFASLPSPHGGTNPSCYRRIKAFSAEMASVLGQRFISMDLDTVITGDLTPIFHRPEDFVIWGETDPRSYYNGSLWMMTAGARRQVYESFDPKTSPRAAYKAGRFGSDQGWVSFCLGKGERVWTTEDGVYSYRKHIAKNANRLPENARIVNFHGRHDPWTNPSKSIPWVQEHYR